LKKLYPKHAKPSQHPSLLSRQEPFSAMHRGIVLSSSHSFKAWMAEGARADKRNTPNDNFMLVFGGEWVK
jgi:hypothetical protein